MWNKISKILFIVLILIFTLNTSAQSSALTDQLQSINASNMDQIQVVANLTAGVGYRGRWSEDGNTFYYNTWHGGYVFDVNNPTKLVRLDKNPIEESVFERNYQELNQPIAISPDGHIGIWSTDSLLNEREGNIIIRDMETEQVITWLRTESPTQPLRLSGDNFTPQFAEDGRVLYTREGSLYQWDPRTRAESLLIEHSEMDQGENFTDLHVNPQGTYAVTYTFPYLISLENTLTIYDITTAPVTIIYQQYFPGSDYWRSLAISPDGTQIAAGGTNLNVRVWDLSKEPIEFQEDHPPREYAGRDVVDIAYSPDGRYIAACVQEKGDFYVLIQDAATGVDLATIDKFTGTNITVFTQVEFHPSGKTIAVGDRHGIIRIWRLNELLAVGNENASTADIAVQAYGEWMWVTNG